jgi:hypothetical protein
VASPAQSSNRAALNTRCAGKVTRGTSFVGCWGTALRKSRAMRWADLDMGPTPCAATSAGRMVTVKIAHRIASTANVLKNVFMPCSRLTSRAQARGTNQREPRSGTGTAIPRCLQRFVSRHFFNLTIFSDGIPFRGAGVQKVNVV